jgi:hypothetical protein
MVPTRKQAESPRWRKLAMNTIGYYGIVDSREFGVIAVFLTFGEAWAWWETLASKSYYSVAEKPL